MKMITLYGESDETDDPSVYEQSVKDAFLWLNENGHRALAISLLDEMGLFIRQSEHLAGRKSSYQAKKDGDWDRLTKEIAECQTLADLATWTFRHRNDFLSLPVMWREPLEEEISKRRDQLKG